MSKLSNKAKMQILLPALSVVLMSGIYFVFDNLFIECKINGCQSIDGKLLSVVEKPLALSNINEHINAKKSEIGNLKNKYNEALKEQKTIEAEAANTQLLLGNQQKQLADEQLKSPKLDANVHQANINAYTAKLTVQNKEANLAQAKTNSALGEVTAEENALKNTAGQISARYSKRIFWLFLSAFVLGFTIIGIGVSANIILRLEKSLRFKWLIWTSVAAFVCFFSILLANEYLLSISNPLFAPTLYTNGDLARYSLLVTNACVFPVIIFFASASCAVNYLVNHPKYTSEELLEIKRVQTETVETTDKLAPLNNIEKPTPEEEAEKSELESGLTALRTKFAVMCKSSVQFHEELRNDAKMILYVGSALLFAGLTRMNVIFDWHLLFVGKDFSVALTPFLQSVVAAQAGFYSILLAVLYFPMVYAIPPKPDVPDGIEATLDEAGFLQTIKEYMPRLIAICSPFLVGPISDLIKQLVGTQSN